MKSSLLFLALALAAQLGACKIASSGGVPPLSLDRVNAVNTMLLLGGQSNKGYAFTATDGAYTARFPGKPRESSQVIQTKIGPITAHLVTYETDGGKRAYIASSTQYKVDPRTYNVEKGLDGSRDGSARKVNATVSKETKINYKGVPGRQFYLILKQGKIKVRIYIVNAGKGPTLYQVLVVDMNGNVDTAEANAFLDSVTFKTR